MICDNMSMLGNLTSCMISMAFIPQLLGKAMKRVTPKFKHIR